MQMSLATAAKRGIGAGPSTPHTVPLPLQEGVSAPDRRSGRRVGPALLQCVEMPCRAASGLGVGCREPEALKSLSSEMMGAAVQSLPADS